MKKFKLSKEPLIWFHYVLLEALILATMLLFGYKFCCTSLWIIPTFYVVIAFGDQLIHWLLGVD